MKAQPTNSKKLWGGRFAKPTDPRVERFTSSIGVDARLARYDVQGSIAHARMLGACGLVSRAEAARLVGGLTTLLRKIERGAFMPDPQAEDIHSQIEAALKALVGPVANKLHTARSRNDQVALDLRLYCRDTVSQLDGQVAALQRALVSVASSNQDVVIPGYTHLQRAQPISLAHHLLAYVEMLQRDRDRLADAQRRINISPLGSGALAGTSLPINRRMVARSLGMAGVSGNSLDAVSDRDFAVELVSALALLGVHVSRFAEDLILWSTEEFGILQLDDAFATGSSLMPQKKNPDVLELIRGQAGIVFGNLTALLTMLKGLPLAYNRDLQWDKAAVFQAVDATTSALDVLTPFVQHMRIRRSQVARLLDSDELCATDIAEELVRHGVAFRIAHEAVGRVVREAAARGQRVRDVAAASLPLFVRGLNAQALRRLDPRRSVACKVSEGGTGPRQVRQALARWQQRLRK
ncbi:MAG: argininosuccinate lyase [Candidatus Omnitrophica bacterium]|nr:argininosuccinate lyase [Candidatus Omnitrophota bacterium]